MTQAKITNLPDTDHVLRHVAWGQLRRDDELNVIGFLGEAFRRREDEESLSVSWLEFYPTPETRLRDAVWAVRKNRKVGSKSAFALACVANLKRVCSEVGGTRVRVVHEPLPSWPAHSGIRRLSRDDEALLEALAADAFAEMVLNSSIPAE
jgi:hypothetical protein